jgi:ABC-2 type transport system permease protein
MDSSTAITVAQPAGTMPQPSVGALPHFAEVLRSEFCKFRSVRSTFWALAAAAGFNVAVAVVLGLFLPGALSAHEKATLDSTRLSLGGLHLSQIAIGVLGVLVITSEYGTGMIRATLGAVPQRRLMLAAKTIVFAAAALIVGILASFAAYFAFQAFVSGSLRTSFSDPGVLRAVIGAGLYLVVLGLLGVGLGAVIRSSAGAVAALFGLLFVPALLVALLPDSWQNTIGPYLPMQAGTAVFSVHHEAHTLGPWQGFGVFCLYAAAALAVAFALINRRDA